MPVPVPAARSEPPRLLRAAPEPGNRRAGPHGALPRRPLSRRGSALLPAGQRTGRVSAASSPPRSIAETVRGRPWFDALETQTLPVRMAVDDDRRGPCSRNHDVSARLVKSCACAPSPPAAQGRPTAVPPAPDSPITLLGDTHALVFHAGDEMHAVGSGLVDQLVYELGLPLDVVASDSPGAALAELRRRARGGAGRPGTGKRLVIWCFAARAITADGAWRAVPARRLKDAGSLRGNPGPPFAACGSAGRRSTAEARRPAPPAAVRPPPGSSFADSSTSRTT